MFYAYNSCEAKQSAFLHFATEKYKGPPPRAMAKNLSAASASANLATVAAGTAALPIVNALPSKLTGAIPWLWDTAAGRHLIGKQALTPKMKEFLQLSRQGGAARPVRSQSLVTALKDCPPAQSIGKTVMDKGFMFV